MEAGEINKLIEVQNLQKDVANQDPNQEIEFQNIKSEEVNENPNKIVILK